MMPLALAALLAMGQSCVDKTPSGGDNSNNSTQNDNTNNNTNDSNNNTTQDPPPKTGLASETQRDAIQSQCAQNFTTCTVVYPRAHAAVVAATGQQVSVTTRLDANGLETRTYHVAGIDHSGSEVVHFLSNSTPGLNATIILYQWSAGASDKAPATLAPGPIVFSDQPNPTVELQTGLHYIRLYIENSNKGDITINESGDTLHENVNLYDFEEIEVEVRD